ncbi:glycosyltransferase family 2 protein [Massilia eburnea]|uniref:glycosyltransferase family 2 protein n=1 Tax=Massilia eburnea TaxID=1776165 RepID=UPI003D6BC2FD
MTPNPLLIQIISIGVLVYFVLLNGGYLMLNFLAMYALRRRSQEAILDDLPQVYSALEPPISMIVPAYNEEATIVTSIRSMLQLSYSEMEVVVINDGSTDRTLQVMIDEFGLVPFPEAYRIQLETRPVKGIYRSTRFPNLRVVDKVNGGKADSTNAGINAARYPLFCCVDADSILQRDSLQRLVRPFLGDPLMVATGGTGAHCQWLRSAGRLPDPGRHAEESMGPVPGGRIPARLHVRPHGLVGHQRHADHLRRLWPVPQGHRGGRRRLQPRRRSARTWNWWCACTASCVRAASRTRSSSYQIRCAGRKRRKTTSSLRNQRIRWSRGLSESLTTNWGLMFSRHGGVAGWMAFPFFMLFEWLGPFVELFGYIFMAVAWWQGWVSWESFLIFLFLAIGLGILLSAFGLLLEEISFHLYPRPSHLLILAAVVVLENFGYRQINSWWRLVGLYKWARREEAKWGVMTRKADWQQDMN